ncbi:MAG: DUF2884 family protein [Colwellia sp.]
MMISFHRVLTTMALTSTLLTSTALYAKEVYVDESCHVELSAGFTINANSTEFLAESSEEKNEKISLYKITQGKTLFVGSELVELNNTQQKLVNEYDAKIRQLVPLVKHVVIEGINSAAEGVNLAFNGLLGEGNPLAVNLTQELMLMRSQVEANLSIEKGISVDRDGLAGEALLGKDFEQGIKSSIEKAVLNSMGSILLAIGQQMIASDGKEQSFEVRMKNFSDNIKQEIALRTAKIAQKSQELCVKMVKIDALEEQLKTEIKSLATTNIFTVIQGN